MQVYHFCVPWFFKMLLDDIFVRPGKVFRKPFLIALRSLSVVEMNSSSWRYCTSSGSVVWSIMLFITASDCRVFRGTSHIPVCLFLVLFICYCTFLWTDISCLYSVFLLGEFSGVPIKFIKLFLGLLISILLIIAPNRHLHPFCFHSADNCSMNLPYGPLYWLRRFSMNIIATATPTVKIPLGNCWVSCCQWQSLELILHVVHRDSQLWQLCHDRWVGAGKDCIRLCQSFKIVTLCIHSLENSIQIVYCLVMILWRGC